MNTPVARKLAAGDARRVAAARAARAAAASRRVAAAKRRMLLLSVLGAVTLGGWVLTATVNLPWVIPALFTALTAGVVELGRRAAAAGARADAELAKRVREAESRAGVPPRTIEVRPVNNATKQQVVDAGAPAPAKAEPEPSSSLTVEVDPAESSSWTPVPVPPPTYTLKAEVRRKVAEPYKDDDAAPKAVSESGAVTAPASERLGSDPTSPAAALTEEPKATTASLNVQEILARRRAVG